MNRRRMGDLLRQRTGRMAHVVTGLVRRLVVNLSRPTGIWNLDGFEGIDSEQERLPDVEVFPGVGFYSRPKDDAKCEVIVVHVGGDEGHPVVIATRDKSIQLSLEDDETAIFNSVAKVKILKTGEIQITAKAGQQVKIDDGSGAVALAKVSEVNAVVSDLNTLRTTFNAHVHSGVLVGGASTAVPTTTDPTSTSNKTGTTVVKGK